ncbi:Protein YIF1B-A-like protein [Dinothrombium tinctorium]|uniref:Protein YIF1 n=1 Tax=Dinothrombium tinctorium TaxID=1965070 RepID=A0A3S3P711_9ACAR|nr:Protein YIF1B-A-like protein [Dinothrombium tinctorium]
MRRQTRQERAERNDNQASFQSNYYYPNTGAYYDPNTMGPQLFDDTSNMSAYSMPTNDYYAQQPPGYGQSAGGYNYYEPRPEFVAATAFLNKQVMDAGSMIIQNQVAAAAGYYTQEVAKTSSTWFGNLKYYFAVDTGYVLKKLLLIFFPFTHKEWSLRYNPQEAIAPKDDVNAPDLYIPTMAFVTYVLVAGYLLGLNNRFSPEQLGIQASAALAWLVMEVMVVLIVCYLMSITSTLGFFHLLAYSSYKFVCMILALLSSLIFFKMGYYVVLAYSSLSLGYFLLRSLRLVMQTDPSTTQTYQSPRNNLYLVLFICFIQPFVMYWLTRHLVISEAEN